MGAHRTAAPMTLDRRRPGVARLVGRGAIATSAALAMAGSGAGLAMATDHGDHGDHGGDGHHSSGWSVSMSSSDTSGSGHRSATICDTGDGGGLADGLLGDLGLGGSSHEYRCDDQGATGSSSSSDSSEHSSQPSSQSSAANSSSGSESQQNSSSSSARRTPQANPENEPPPLGETSVIPIRMG